MVEIEFGINRMVAPKLGLEDFLDLAAAVGAVGVELRNDLQGLDVIDGMEPDRVRDLLAERGLRVLTINAVQHFNLPTAFEGAMTELRRLIRFADSLGRPAVVMCPHNDPADGRSPDEMARDTETTLREYAPILRDAGIVGLVEPLGFPESSLRDPRRAAAIVASVDPQAYAITLDTFHFAVAGQRPEIIGDDALPAERIGMVHLSGVTRPGPVAEFRDPDRVYVDERDRCGNIETVARLRAAGYTGAFSFEPFSPEVHRLSRQDTEQRLLESMAVVRSGARKPG